MTLRETSPEKPKSHKGCGLWMMKRLLLYAFASTIYLPVLRLGSSIAARCPSPFLISG